jgi:LppP/LprE lipoprotein
MRRLAFAALLSLILLPWPTLAQVVPTAPPGSEPKPAAGGELQNWLDGPRRDWNTAGMTVPGPGVDISVVGCEAGLRPAETAEDEAVVAAGWRLGEPFRAAWGVKVIEGIAWLDGLCRPIRYQEFVFVDGTFAGTIAPTLMSSRAGDPGRVEWFNRDSVHVEFERFRPGDAFCCPSGAPVRLTFNINRTPSGPVLQMDTR